MTEFTDEEKKKIIIFLFDQRQSTEIPEPQGGFNKAPYKAVLMAKWRNKLKIYWLTGFDYHYRDRKRKFTKKQKREAFVKFVEKGPINLEDINFEGVENHIYIKDGNVFAYKPRPKYNEILKILSKILDYDRVK